MNVDALAETLMVPKVGQRLRCSGCKASTSIPNPLGIRGETHGEPEGGPSDDGQHHGHPEPPARQSLGGSLRSSLGTSFQ